MLLSEIRIVDLRYSRWDEAKSSPKDGIYVFTDKKYVDNKTRRSDWYLTWCGNTPARLQEALVKEHCVPVKVSDGDFFAEGADINGEGNFQVGDVVLARKPLMEELLKRESNTAIAARRAKDRMKSFDAAMNAQGAGLPKEVLEQLNKG